jgi:hypothetical protein
MTTRGVLALPLIACAASALAADAPYAGKWSMAAEACAKGQDQETAPMLMRERGFDQHEVHCAFKSIRRDGDGWRIKSRCLVDGNRQPYNFRLRVAGDTLTMTEGGHDRVFSRCP